jgi:predicted DNA-binding antitoxin AbrB/MazE fold protein
MQIVAATWQNGSFSPKDPVALAEGTEVTVVIDAETKVQRGLSRDDQAFFRDLAERRKEVFRRLAE